MALSYKEWLEQNKKTNTSQGNNPAPTTGAGTGTGTGTYSIRSGALSFEEYRDAREAGVSQEDLVNYGRISYQGWEDIRDMAMAAAQQNLRNQQQANEWNSQGLLAKIGDVAKSVARGSAKNILATLASAEAAVAGEGTVANDTYALIRSIMDRNDGVSAWDAFNSYGNLFIQRGGGVIPSALEKLFNDVGTLAGKVGINIDTENDIFSRWDDYLQEKKAAAEKNFYDKVGEVNNIYTAGRDYRDQQAQQEQMQKQIDYSKSPIAQNVYKYGTMVGSQLPTILEGLALAYMNPVAGAETIAGGLAPATTEGLLWLNEFNKASKLGQLGMLATNSIGSIATNPQYWTSVAMETGSAYNEAINANVDPSMASAYALSYGLLSGIIEVGGGDEAASNIENLPKKIRESLLKGEKGKAAWEYAKSIIGEIGEEEWQDMLSKTLSGSMLGQNVPVFSMEDENAIINPRRMGQTAIDTAITTALMGAGERAVIGGTQSLLDSRKYTGSAQALLNAAKRADGDTAKISAIESALRRNGQINVGQARTLQSIIEDARQNPETRSSMDTGFVRDNLQAMFRSAGIDATDAELDVLANGYVSGTNGVSNYLRDVSNSFNYGSMGLTLEQARKSAELAGSTLNPVQFEHAFKLGEAKSADTADITTEEGREKVLSHLQQLGNQAEGAADVYESTQDVQRYAEAMGKAVQLFAANGGNLKTIWNDAKTGKTMSSISYLTEKQIDTAQKLGAEFRTEQAESASRREAAFAEKRAKLDTLLKKGGNAAEYVDSTLATQRYISQLREDIRGFSESLATARQSEPGIVNTAEYKDAVERLNGLRKDLQGAMELQKQLKKGQQKAIGKKPRRKKGKVVYADKAGNASGIEYQAVDRSKLSKTQQATTRIAEAIADATGLEIRIISVPTTKTKGVGGEYIHGAGGVMYLNIDMTVDGKNMAAGSLFHELTHWIQEYAPAKYEELKRFVLQESQKNPEKFEDIFNVRKETSGYKDLNAEKVTDEMVANACMRIFEDPEAVKRLAVQHKGLWETIRDFIVKFVDDVKAAFAEMDFSSDFNLMGESQLMVDSLEQMRDRFIDAFSTATENYQAEQIVEAAEENDEPSLAESTTQLQAWEGEEPKNFQYGFKLMNVDENGLPHAMFIDAAKPYEFGKLYAADSPKLENLLHLEPGYSYLIDENDNADMATRKPFKKTTRINNKGQKATSYSGLPGKTAINSATMENKRWMLVDRYSDGTPNIQNVGINGSGTVSMYALRPGLHAVDIPSMTHIGAQNKTTKKIDRRRPDQRWFLIEYPVDVDYNQEAYSHESKDIRDHLPERGWYSFQTNSGAEAKQHWFITGGMRIVGGISEEDARWYAREHGFEEDLPWKDGKSYDDSQNAVDLKKYVQTTKVLPTPSKEEMRQRIESERGTQLQAWEEGPVYNDRALVSEETLNKWLDDYAASNPDYAQAYITYMSPSKFLEMTTSDWISRGRIKKEADGLSVENAAAYTKGQPIQLIIDTETGKVLGHEGRHRMVALDRAGVDKVPVLLFDSKNKDSKTAIDTLELTQQDFSKENHGKVYVHDVQPLSRGNADVVREKFSKKGVKERVYERSLNAKTVQFQQFESGAIRDDLETLSKIMDTNEAKLQVYAMENDEQTYRDMLTRWGGMSETQINDLFDIIDDAMETIKGNLEALDYAWEADIDDRAFSPVKQNSDKLYKVSNDFSTLCRKRILQGVVVGELQGALDRALTTEEGIAIRDALVALQEEGKQIEVACALCYVESARMKSPEQIQRFLNDRERVIRDYFAGKDKEETKARVADAEAEERQKIWNEYGLINGLDVRDSKTASLKKLPDKIADRIRAAKKTAKANYKPTEEQQRTIDAANRMKVTDFTTPEGLENLARNHRELFNAYTSFVRNATQSKGIENDTWWRAGDSKKISDILIEQMNRENGLRTQSWSDFQVKHLMDYIAATIELSTRGAKQHAYTKVPDYVDLMGKTGVMINMSLIPTREYSGKLEYDNVEGFIYKKALELRKKYPETAGTICIGVADKQIRQLLESDEIDYVIPYHRSGMSAHVRAAMHIPAWEDYQGNQNEKPLAGEEARANAKQYKVDLLPVTDKKWHKGPSFSEWFDLKKAVATQTRLGTKGKYGVMTGGYMAMQEAAEKYKKLCAERGLAPKFSYGKADFTTSPNYWKLLIDRKMVNNVTGEIIEQKPLQPNFEMSTIQRILNEELERYGKVKEDQDEAIRRVTEAFLSGKIKGGMSSGDIAQAMQKPVDNISITNIVENAQLQQFEGDNMHPRMRAKLNEQNRLEEDLVQYFAEMDRNSDYWMSEEEVRGNLDFNFYNADVTKGDAYDAGRIIDELLGHAKGENLYGRQRAYLLAERLLPHVDATVRQNYVGGGNSERVYDAEFASWYNERHPSIYYPGYQPGDLFEHKYDKGGKAGNIQKERDYLHGLLESGNLMEPELSEARDLLDQLTNPQPGVVFYQQWSEAAEDERQINQITQEISELEDRADIGTDNEELRKINMRLVKLNADRDRLIAKERKLSRKTSIDDILKNLSAYRYSDLESIAEQYSDSAWDVEPGTTREQLESELREALETLAEDMTPLQRQAPAMGYYVRPAETRPVSYQQFDDTYNDTKEESTGRDLAYSRIQSENAILNDVLKELQQLTRKQENTIGKLQQRLKLTKTPEVREGDAKRLAGKYLRTWDSKANREEITQSIKELGDYVLRGEVNADEVTTRAREIASKIVSAAETTVAPENEALEQIRTAVNGQKVYLSSDMLGELDQSGGLQAVKNRLFGKRVYLSTEAGNDRISVDRLYEQLHADFGEYWFPEAGSDKGPANAGEEILLIAEVLDAAGGMTVNPFGPYMGEAVQSLANDIVSDTLGGIMRPVQTDADKWKSRRDGLNERIKELKKQGELQDKEAARLWQTVYDLSIALDKAESRYKTLQTEADYRVAQTRAEGEAKVAEVRARERERADKQIQGLKDYYKDMRERAQVRREESAGVTKYRKQVQKKAAALYEMLMKNDDKKHVPEVLKKPVAEFLESIDFTSKRQLRGGEETNADREFGVRLRELERLLSNQQKYVDGENLSDSDQARQQKLDGFLDIHPENLQYLRDVIEMIDTALRENRDFTINSMNAQQLKQLSNFLSNLNAAIRGLNTFMANARFESVREAASKDIEFFESLGDASSGDLSGSAGFLKWLNGTPYYVFRRFGEGGQAIFDGLTAGWDQMAFDVQEIMAFTEKLYTTKEVTDWKNTVHQLTLEDGSKIEMTTAQIMELAMLLNREQALKHIEHGGIAIADFEVKKGARKEKKQNLRQYHLSYNDIQAITGLLSERQIQVAKALQQYMAKRGAEWGNEVSMRRFGYEFYTEGENYYPIKTMPTDRPMSDSDLPDNTSMFRLLNLSSSKSLNPKASNALVVGNIFDTFADHMSDMAKLHGMGLPILDAIKWFNYKVKVDGDTEGTYKTRTIQAAMKQAYGGKALSYFRTLLRDINGTTETGDRGTGIIGKFVSNYKIAAVGANLRVALLQPTSYVRATAVIKPQFLAGVVPSRAAYREAMKYSGTAVWKDMGFFDTDVARSMRGQIQHDDTAKDKLAEKAMWFAEMGDKLTWSMLWTAAKRQTAAENPGLKGEELMQKTGELFRKTIYASQIMDSTLTRSELMRSKSTHDKALSAFMAEPTLSYNILLDAYSQYNLDSRKHGKAEAWARNSGKIGKAFAVYTSSAVFSAIVESLADALRDDDRDELLDKWLEAFLGEDTLNTEENFWTRAKSAWLKGNLGQDLSILGKLPFIKDIMSILQGYGASNMSTDGIESLLQVLDLFNGNVSKRITPWGKLYKYGMKPFSQLSGLPVANLARDVVAIWNNTVGNINKDLWLQKYDSIAMTDEMMAGFDAYVKDTGISAQQYKNILSKANTDGNTGVNQTEMGTYLVDALASGKLTEEQAQALWKSQWNKPNSKTFDKWRGIEEPKAPAPESTTSTETAKAPAVPDNKALDHDGFKKAVPVYSDKKEAIYNAKPAGMTLDRYLELLQKADTSGNSSITQDEMGFMLRDAVTSGEITFEEAEAIWRAQWNSARSNTLLSWANKHQ